MLKRSANFVVASFRPSTWGRVYQRSEAL